MFRSNVDWYIPKYLLVSKNWSLFSFLKDTKCVIYKYYLIFIYKIINIIFKYIMLLDIYYIMSIIGPALGYVIDSELLKIFLW